MEPITTFADLLSRAVTAAPGRVALAGADGATSLRALAAACEAGFATPVLVGDPSAIARALEAGDLAILADSPVVAAAGAEDAAARATALVRAGDATLLLKGSVRTDQLLRALLDREAGLRTGRLLSDVLLYEDLLEGRRLVGITDGGINVAPDADALRQVVRNAVEVFRALGYARPRVALLSATEVPSDAVPSTRAAAAVADWAAGGLPGADVAGPLALDNALLASAAAAKGIGGPVAGRADILVAPGIEAGNLLGKAAKYMGGSITVHVVVGARVPVLIPSRVESAADKLHSIALGVVVGDAFSAADGSA